MIKLTNHWVWDSWYFTHEGTHHAFYLQAPRSLGDADKRHTNARIGHSVSTDLVTWTALEDALAPGEPGDFDDLAIWTGSIVRHGDLWHMFYTGVQHATTAAVQRIGHAVSDDLITWTRVSTDPVSTADPRWYATSAIQASAAEPWRDPWVFHSTDDGLWHMLVTASEVRDGVFGHGCVGHATSSDLYEWEVAAPLTLNSGFRQIEVTQVVELAGKYVLIFCAAAADRINPEPSVAAATGTYSAPADGPLGPFHLDRAEIIGDAGIYAGRIVLDSAGQPALLGFIDSGEPGGFEGTICNPIALELTARGTLQPLA